MSDLARRERDATNRIQVLDADFRSTQNEVSRLKKKIETMEEEKEVDGKAEMGSRADEVDAWRKRLDEKEERWVFVSARMHEYTCRVP